MLRGSLTRNRLCLAVGFYVVDVSCQRLTHGTPRRRCLLNDASHEKERSALTRFVVTSDALIVWHDALAQHVNFRSYFKMLHSYRNVIRNERWVLLRVLLYGRIGLVDSQRATLPVPNFLIHYVFNVQIFTTLNDWKLVRDFLVLLNSKTSST